MQSGAFQRLHLHKIDCINALGIRIYTTMGEIDREERPNPFFIKILIDLKILRDLITIINIC